MYGLSPSQLVEAKEKAAELTEFYPRIRSGSLFLLAIHKLWEEKWLAAGLRPDTKKPKKKGLFD